MRITGTSVLPGQSPPGGGRATQIAASKGSRAVGVLAVFLFGMAPLLAASSANPPATSQHSKPGGYTFKQWHTEDGLPQMSVMAITQTRDGYLWVGTFNGLARFDGMRFTTFTVNNAPEIRSDTITVLHETADGVLWIGTGEGGLVRYTEGKFAQVPGPEESKQMTVHSIRENPPGDLWVATSTGVYRVLDGRLERPSGPLSAKRDILGVLPQTSEELWVCTDSAVELYRNGNKVLQIPSRRQIDSIEADLEGNVWVAFAAGWFGIIRPGAQQMHIPRMSRKAGTILRGSDGTLWIGTIDGKVLRASDGDPVQFIQEAAINGAISSVFQDADANLWVGLDPGGLCRLRRKQVAILGKESGLEVEGITSLCEDGQGRVWAGTFGRGLHRWDGEKFERSPLADTPNVTSVIEGHDGTLWIGSFSGGTSRILESKKLEQRIEFARSCRTLFKDRDGGIWLGTLEQGVEHWSGGRIRRYTVKEGLSSDYARAIAQDRNGDIWVGTSHGLNRIRQGKITRYYREHGLAGNHIRSLFVDGTGTLWIGATGGGLTRWNNEGFETVGLEKGLIDDWIEQIVEDDFGNLWLGSNRGLMRIERNELEECISGKRQFVHCTAFRREEGLVLPNTGTGFQPSCLKRSDGTLWFGTDAGIVVINPARLHSDAEAPQVYIEEITVNGRARAVLAGASQHQVLAPGVERLEFRFTGLDFAAPALVRFRYKLEGFDSEWVNAGTKREAVYTRVPPGDYQFRVVASNNEGVRNETGATLAITIRPFFWQTRTFAVAAGTTSMAAIVLMVWAVHSWHHRQELQELEHRHALERERTRIAQDMHDGLGASLVKIAMLGELAESRIAEADHGRPQVHRISATARQIVRDMDEIVWAVNPKNDTLENFADYLCQFAVEHFNETGLKCHLDVPRELPVRLLRAEIRHNLFLSVREALNNVLKHARARNVWLRMDMSGEQLSVTVEDDGNGFEEVRRHGNGLGNMEQRLAQIEGSMNCTSRTGGGTTVRFQIRLPRTGI